MVNGSCEILSPFFRSGVERGRVGPYSSHPLDALDEPRLDQCRMGGGVEHRSAARAAWTLALVSQVSTAPKLRNWKSVASSGEGKSCEGRVGVVRAGTRVAYLGGRCRSEARCLLWKRAAKAHRRLARRTVNPGSAERAHWENGGRKGRAFEMDGRRARNARRRDAESVGKRARRADAAGLELQQLLGSETLVGAASSSKGNSLVV